MKNIFTQVQAQKIGSNTFDLSHDRKMSLNMGDLVPIHVMETVPGDSIKMSTSQLLRLAPMIAPVMHQVNVYTHFFFVPNRILWSNWEDFITGGEDGLNTSVFPNNAINVVESGSLSDYLGLPTFSLEENIPISMMPHAAYQCIYNEYYRDQNLIDPINWRLTDAQQLNPERLMTMRTRAWQHDYFTSALPWTQKGAEATIPVTQGDNWSFSGGEEFNQLAENAFFLANNLNPARGHLYTQDENAVNRPVTLDIEASTINDLRNAFRLQEWLEKNARGGSRYIESILSHFGVRSSDARLQRPEYLGGGSSPVTISEVLQTSANASEPTPQGNMSGHGISAGANNSFSYRCEEHGYIIGIMSILPKTAYQQGVPKHFRKFDKFDYYWPSFAHLGEQPISQIELYIREEDNDDVFGYTPRYAEYKFINSSVHGEFRESLDYWHMGRIFANSPNLNETFITSDPTDRIFAVIDAEKIYAHVYHRIKATRKMPYFGTPTI